MRASIVYFSILASLVASANALEIAPARRGVAILSRNNDGKHLPLDIRCTDWELTMIIRHHFDKLMRYSIALKQSTGSIRSMLTDAPA